LIFGKSMLAEKLGQIFVIDHMLPLGLGDGPRRLEQLVLRPAIELGIGRELVDLIIVLARPQRLLRDEQRRLVDAVVAGEIQALE
jgi:hypothetical protein